MESSTGARRGATLRSLADVYGILGWDGGRHAPNQEVANMIVPSLPQDPQVRAAIGDVAVRHGQLDYALRMMVKSISGIGLDPALDATEGKSSRDLRQLIRKMAKKKLGAASNSFLLLEALLTRAQRVTQQRNELLHGLWAFDLDEGRDRFRHKGRAWGKTPETDELEALANETAQIAADLHEARLSGFLKEALSEPEDSSVASP